MQNFTCVPPESPPKITDYQHWIEKKKNLINKDKLFLKYWEKFKPFMFKI